MNLAQSLAVVNKAADPLWKQAADEEILWCAENFKDFTTDDVWDRLSIRGIHTHEHRAMGPRMNAAVKAGICKIATCDHCMTTKVVRNSFIPESHAKNVAVYQSLIYKGEDDE